MCDWKTVVYAEQTVNTFDYVFKQLLSSIGFLYNDVRIRYLYQISGLIQQTHFFFLFFSVRLLSVLRGHSVFTSPPQRPMTSNFEGFSIPDFIHYIYFPILILEKEPVFPIWMCSAKQGHYWYHFYNFGMTRSLTWDWTRNLPHSKPVLYH